MRSRLIQANPVLTPAELSSLIPAYTDFELSQKGFLWIKREPAGQNPTTSRYQKVFLLLSGVSAGGKHAFLDRLQALLPHQVFALVTATTRPPKDEEREGIDHYFYPLERFLREKAEGQFIEFIEQAPGRWYGTLKMSIKKALARPESIIVSDIEMGSGWPSVDEYMASLSSDIKPKVVEVFMLPEMRAQTYFETWLPEKRPQDFEARGLRAAWEIWNAPTKADFLLTNPIGKGADILNGEAKVVMDQLQSFLSATLSSQI